MTQLSQTQNNFAATSAADLCFHIPHGEESEFALLPNSAKNPMRDDVRFRLLAVKSIHEARFKVRAAKSLAAQWNGRRGFKANTLMRLYYEFVRTNDWRVLVDRHRAGKAWRLAKGSAEDYGIAGRPEFIAEFKRRCEINQRKIAPAIRSLRRDLKAWRQGDRSRAIPGYTRPPADDPATGLPHGWNEGNLYRYAPSKLELTAARIGPMAAGMHRLPVLTSRVGLAVGEFFLFDDHEFNLKVNFPGQSRAMRPMMFGALDLLSGCLFGQGFRPTLWDDKEQKKSVLKESDFRWFVIHILLTHGYRANTSTGTTFIVEHGTAAIREPFEKCLDQVTRGKVRVQRSGKISEPILKGLFPGQVRGNFKFKAGIETIFGLVDNEFAALPGQVGMDRQHSPEELHGRDRENNQLLKAASLLPPEVAAKLQMGFLNWDSFIAAALEVFDRMNARTDHKLEGWRKCGHVIDEWRPAAAVDAWQPAAALLDFTSAERMAVGALLRSKPELSRSRFMSPAEVWGAGRAQLRKLPLVLLPDLMGDEPGTLARVDKGLFRMQRDGEELIFQATINGHPLPAGEKFELFFDPFSPRAAVIVDATRKVLGVSPAYDRVSRSDGEGINHLLGTANHWQAESLAALKSRHGRIARREAARKAHNAQVLNGNTSNEEVFTAPDGDAYEKARAGRARRAAAVEKVSGGQS